MIVNGNEFELPKNSWDGVLVVVDVVVVGWFVVDVVVVVVVVVRICRLTLWLPVERNCNLITGK